MSRLVLVLGDQLSGTLSALKAADKDHDLVVMAEVTEEATSVAHHPKKIALIFAAMRKFAAQLEQDGWQVAYTRLDDPGSTGSIPGELLRRAAETRRSRVVATRPGDWRLIERLEEVPLTLDLREDDRFLASPAEFEAWAKGRKQLRMEYFYRDMRRKTGLLMDGDAPAGGAWNYDQENRKPAGRTLHAVAPMRFSPDAVTEEVLDLVETRFGHHFGALRPFWFPTDRDQANRAFDHFLRRALPYFGDYQDAMLRDDRFLFHAVISPAMNIGLLDPLEICRAVEAEWRAGRVPINAAEGFIRQIIGWREFVRGIWHQQGPGYPENNVLDHRRNLPGFYWSGDTRMACVAAVVDQTRAEAYAHHIQRLMVTGNFALLAGIEPVQVHEWYLSVYADAFEWVEAPNTIGMSQFADGGIVASKPYVSSGAYLNRMSDYCGDCHYRVADKTGARACPFNLLYWHFLDRHRARFSANPRMGNMYRTWDRMNEDRRATILAEADILLTRLDRGDPV